MNLPNVTKLGNYVAAVLILVAIGISIYPTIYRVLQTQPGTTFPLVHNYHSDYFANLQFMRQGYEGNFLIKSRLTPEPFNGQFVQTFLAVLGLTARLTRLALPVVYTLARVIFGVGLLITVYLTARKVFSSVSSRVLALFFVAFATPIWWLEAGRGLRFPLDFWTELDPIRRTTFLPHHLAGTLLSLLAIYFFAAYLRKPGWKIATPALLVALAGYINPPALLNFYFSLLLFLPLFIYFQRPKKKEVSVVSLNILILGAISFIPVVYLFYISNTTFPWTTYRDWEATAIYGVDLKNYLMTLGPASLLSIFGIYNFIKNRTVPKLFIVAWFFAPFIPLFLIHQFIPISNMRFLQVAHYIPVGLLAAAGLAAIAKLLHRRLKIPKWSVVWVILVSLTTYFSLYHYHAISSQLRRWHPYLYNIYLSDELLLTFEYLDKTAPYESVVLAGELIGTLIPSYASNKVFIGHPVITYKLGEKRELLARFLAQDDLEFSGQLIQAYKVEYLLFAQDTAAPNVEFVSKLGFEQIFSGQYVTLFKKSR